MEQAIWALRLIVAALFAVAAWGKLADRLATRQAVQDFGLPARFAAAAAWALPIVELGVAVAVLPAASAVITGFTALALLAVFTAAIAVQLRQGRHPGCSCFGASTAPISGWTLARNAGIAALVGLALWGSFTHREVPAALPVEQAVGLALAVMLGAMQVRQAATIRTLRQQLLSSRTPRPAGEGLPLGTLAPAFDLPDTDGQRSSLASLLTTGQPVLLIFLHPKCSQCSIVAGELAQWRAGNHGALTVMPISSGDIAANVKWAHANHLGRMLVQESNEVALSYQLRGTPSAVLIDPRGRIAALPAGGPRAVRELLTRFTPAPAGS